MGIRLLFADDSATMRKVVQLALEQEDVDLKITGDGESAFEAAKDELPDIIIADVLMPGLDGFGLCKKVKDNASTARIPVVLITGEMEEYDDKKGEDVGASAHITKPFKSGELLNTIRKLVERTPGEAEKPAMLERVAKAGSVEDPDDGELEAVATNPKTPVRDSHDIGLNLDDLDLQDLHTEFSPDNHEKVVEQILDSGVVAPQKQMKGADLRDLGGLESGDDLWNDTLRELAKDAEAGKEAGKAPSATTEGAEGRPEFAAPTVGAAEVQRIFRELTEKAVSEFMASRATDIFREEVSKAIGSHVKGIIEAQYEKAFREELTKILAQSFGRAMPKMLGTMEKITLQITPKIAEQMIKAAIEKIKGAEIN